MIATLYKLPGWIGNPENKPSLQVFNKFLASAQTTIIETKTITTPDLLNIVVQASGTTLSLYNYNYIKLDNLWYLIKNITTTQLNNPVVAIQANIDVYLSFIIAFMDEQSQVQTPVFFIQKHLNRYFYNVDGTTSIYFEQQYYLNNKHRALAGVGVRNAKAVDSVSNIYNQWNTNQFSQPVLFSNSALGYLYILWKLTSGEQSQTMYYQCSTLGLINYLTTGNSYQETITINNQNYSNGVMWWELLSGIGSDAYVDIINLPLPIEWAQIFIGADTFSSTTLSITTLQNFAPNTYGSLASNTLVWNSVPQNLYYFFNPEYASSLNAYNQMLLMYQEPYLLQYCSLIVRGAGEDSVVDITGFNNWTVNGFISCLYSFVIALNHPTTQITNISYSDYLIHSHANNSTVVQPVVPYIYNMDNDAYFAINWKCTYPSASNNWNNYMLNNRNQYEMGLNIAHYHLQEAQANIGFNAAKLAVNAAGAGMITDDWFSDIANPSAAVKAWDRTINSAQELTDSVFEEQVQQQNYNYERNGKKADMSRTANERLAVGNNAIAYSTFGLMYIFSYVNNYDMVATINYINLNGYVVEQWIPWCYWNNRKYCNFVKCSYFTDAMIPTLNRTYREMVDVIMVKGFRVWTSNNQDLTTIPFANLNYTNPSYTANNELNQNNNELEYLWSDTQRNI